MTLQVLGLGLVSPAGTRARDHVFFPRAGAPPPCPSPFSLEDGRALQVGRCPWIGPLDDVELRIVALARAAVREALSVLPAGERLRLPVALCAPAPRPGLDALSYAGLAAKIGVTAGASSIEHAGGAAGVFAALERLLAAPPPAALLVGVDSFVCAAALGERARRPPSPWLPQPVPPAEGAGALLVATPAEAERLGVAPIGEITESRAAPGRSSDDDDEVVDGSAMTSLLQGLPAPSPIRSVFGQGRVDLLRSREWEWTVARAAARFHPEYFGPCLEAEIGGVGAAAGVMNLAFGFAMLRHGAAPPEAVQAGSLVAWAISRDGLRGAASGALSAARAQASPIALAGAARARQVVRDPPRESAPEGEPELDEEALLEGAEAGPPEPPANDLEPMPPALPEDVAAAPPVLVDPARGAPIAPPAFYAGVVVHCAETAAALGRDRREAPLSALGGVDERLLCQLDAIVAAGGGALADLCAWWEEQASDPWAAFAGTLGAAAFEGGDALEPVARAALALEDGEEAHAEAIVEALSLSEHPDLTALAQGLARSPRDLARAIGVGVLGARGPLSLEAIGERLEDPAPLAARAAIDASTRLPAPQRAALAPALRERCAAPDAGVAFAATRALLLQGDREARAVFARGGLDVPLGPSALELLALCGAPSDLPRVEAQLARYPLAPDRLAAAGRFGAPALTSLLVRCLADEALAEAAARALAVILGPIVPPAQALDAGAWRAALRELTLDPRLRYRGGRPWAPAAVLAECEARALPRPEIALRVDELRAHLGLSEPVDLTGWWPSAQAAAGAFLALARSRAAGRGAG